MWLLDRFLKKLVRQGQLIIVESNGHRHSYGVSEGEAPVTVRFHDPEAPDFVAIHPYMGSGEAYMDGRMSVDDEDIMGLIRLILKNTVRDNANMLEGGIIPRTIQHLTNRFQRLNWEKRSKQNVAHHYDLDGRLYDLFLDKDRQYSCGYFTDIHNSLDQAQLDKKIHIASKLDLKSGQRILDIGCGWGGMAIFIGQIADVEVLGVTLSEEQLKIARKRAKEAGLDDRVKFQLIDYREVKGCFDRIVSVGMFEHVGPPYYKNFFNHCRDLLTDDGVLLLHTIGRLGLPGTTDPWTNKYIFPGGYCPALSEIVSASEQSGLILSDIENLRLHYMYTLNQWYKNVLAARAEIIKLYDVRFYRMWTFYLAGASAAFQYGQMCNYQLQYIRKRDSLPLTRDYMFESEALLREQAKNLSSPE
ncbi:SAM-dependent methyltransferase [Zymomonas mobilis]|uniref:SAM-dependent methyltransferase n=1 Tax=Zymomonas mobilis TaxID=542 RepID=UPI0003C7512D|nr:cyclopropane-fatty-acyl-phospholipid synthase family protein [Zymomonas mobilis]AHB09615.1 cyclopropane-fatty-acyl-phospholipid synthase [Zymomonas mobilis subsp. mobilis str. CP4 = NRRL B-14023]AHJ69920.1 Cyclopropane-fatty-acyl-phospholipid synthase [Zymomonas mobilis subsp. mobilis NRRL B-12526]AHJ71775.1 Cyclopropane-fatty-acyl-phospholipid synthase [Zymomonas mobilis subsp. mobilis str. CP4 = NRRL B-14023]